MNPSPLSPAHPLWAMAFRPLYLLAALYGAVSVLLWGFGYTGTAALPGWHWHAHEMIWGYAGAVVAAFLLTAVATWTGMPPVRGRILMLLVALWTGARITAFLPGNGATALLGTAFFWLAAWLMGKSVLAGRNRRNYIAVAALFAFGLSHLVFHLFLLAGHSSGLRSGLGAGIMMVAGFIGLIGNRVIPFFTARRLGGEQVSSPAWAVSAALLLPLAAALLMMAALPPAAAALPAAAAGILGMVQCVRWFDRRILAEPMLWSLHLGYLSASAGLLATAAAAFFPQWHSLGIHLLAVGGIGLLTVSMMTRTALGHTGRPLYPAPRYLPAAFWLMAAAALFRSTAALSLPVNATAYLHSLRLSAALFAASLLIYFVRYLPWLTRKRADGKEG